MPSAEHLYEILSCSSSRHRLDGSSGFSAPVRNLHARAQQHWGEFPHFPRYYYLGQVTTKAQCSNGWELNWLLHLLAIPNLHISNKFIHFWPYCHFPKILFVLEGNQQVYTYRNFGNMDENAFLFLNYNIPQTN